MKKYEIKAEIRVELTQEDIDDIMVGRPGGRYHLLVQRSVTGGW